METSARLTTYIGILEGMEHHTTNMQKKTKNHEKLNFLFVNLRLTSSIRSLTIHQNCDPPLLKGISTKYNLMVRIKRDQNFSYITENELSYLQMKESEKFVLLND